MSSSSLRPAPSAVVVPLFPWYLGGIAATAAGAITHPIDQTKIRVQTQAVRHGMFATFANSWRSGGLLGLWEGASATVMRQAVNATTRFGVYAVIKDHLFARQLQQGNISPYLPGYQLVGSGIIAGSLAGIVTVPTELVLVRMCADAVKPAGKQLRYRHALDGLVQIVKTEGLSQLSRGLSTVVIRSALMSASQLSSYDKFKQLLLSTPYFSENTNLHIASSILAGIVAVTVVAPVDVIKSRIQASTESKSALLILRDSVAKDGPMVLYRGWLPSLARLLPTTILTFVFLEEMKRQISVYRACKVARLA